MNVPETIVYATEKHSGQSRKNGSPYILHPLRVFWFIVEVLQLNDENLLKASLCHDILEDTPTTFDELRDTIGTEAAVIVEELTNDGSLPRDEKKRKMIEHAKYLSISAAMVKCADRIDNLRDMRYAFSEKGMRVYSAESVLLHESLTIAVEKHIANVENLIDRSVGCLTMDRHKWNLALNTLKGTIQATAV